MSEASVHLFLDSRKEKKNNKYPVKITIYHLKDKKRYSTGIDLSSEEWEKLNAPKLRDPDLKEQKLKLEAKVRRANDILKNLDEFSFEEFENQFYGANLLKANNSFTLLFKSYIDELKKEERLGTASSYNTTYNSLIDIKKNFRINEITTSFLKQYEEYHRKKGSSDATIGINMRNIRAVINKAISMKLLSQDKYPFKGYTIPSGQNIKKALTWEDIQKLLKHQPNTTEPARALDFWKFSYLCNGMNIKDIALLKHTDVDNDFLQFRRAKTIRTRKKDQRPIKVALHPKAVDIINKYKSDDNPYVFGILEPELEAVTVRNRIQRLVKFINKHMKEIGKELSINTNANFNLTTYAARHSFATTLKRKGVSTDEISEFLGHASVGTTKAYLDSFADELLKERSKLLVE